MALSFSGSKASCRRTHGATLPGGCDWRERTPVPLGGDLNHELAIPMNRPTLYLSFPVWILTGISERLMAGGLHSP